MTHDESTSTSSPPSTVPASTDGSPSAEVSVATVPAAPESVPAGRVWGFALLAGLLAGGLSAALGEQLFETFTPGLVPEVVNGQTSMVPDPDEIALATRKNAALTFGLMGGLTGLAMALAGARASRRPSLGAWEGVVGLVLGLLATATIAWLATPAYFLYESRVQANEGGEHLLIPLLVHAGIWGTVGAVGGLAFGLGVARNPREMVPRTLIGGFVGALIGAVLYELLGGAFFPMDKTPQPFAETLAPRVMAMMLTCLGAAVLIAFSVVDAQRTRSSA